MSAFENVSYDIRPIVIKLVEHGFAVEDCEFRVTETGGDLPRYILTISGTILPKKVE